MSGQVSPVKVDAATKERIRLAAAFLGIEQGEFVRRLVAEYVEANAKFVRCSSGDTMSAAATEPRIVVFEETGEEREIVRRCRRCEKYLRWAPGYGVISPRGIEHVGCDGGMTGCGLDATGDGWWWPL